MIQKHLEHISNGHGGNQYFNKFIGAQTTSTWHFSTLNAQGKLTQRVHCSSIFECHGRRAILFSLYPFYFQDNKSIVKLVSPFGNDNTFSRHSTCRARRILATNFGRQPQADPYICLQLQVNVINEFRNLPVEWIIIAIIYTINQDERKIELAKTRNA